MNDDPNAAILMNEVGRRQGRPTDGTSFKAIAIALTIGAAAFAFDLLLPLGVAGGVPYVALVLVGIWFSKPLHIYLLAVIGTVLTIVGYLASPYGGILWVVLTNRGLALFTIWITAILIASRKHYENRLRLTRDALATEVDEQTHELRKKNALVSLLHQVAVAAATEKNVEQAIQICLDRICAYTGWPIGHVYSISKERPGTLVPTAIWHMDDETRFVNFRKVTEETEFETGMGLPGRVLESGKAVWIRDVGEDPGFPRAKLTGDISSHAGFGFPVLVDNKVMAVLEFFSTEVTEPDELLLQVVDNIGAQFGRVMERELAEEALQESEAKFRSAFENTTIAMALTSDRQIRLVNQAMCRLLGYSKQELEAMNYQDIVHPDDLGEYKKNRPGVLSRTAASYSREAQYRHKDGHKIWASISNSPVIGDDGKIRFYVSMLQDISTRVMAEQALQESEARFRDFAASASDRFWETDRNHRFSYVSPNISGSHHLPAEKMLGKTRWELNPRSLSPRELDEHRADFEAHRPFRDFRYTRVTDDGVIYYIRANGQPFSDKNGNFAGYRGTIVDETSTIEETKKREAELIQAKEQYQDLYENAPIAYCSISYVDGSVLLHNAALVKLLGYQSEDLDKMKVFDFYADTPNGLPKAREAFEMLREGQEVSNTELQMKRKDGEIIWVNLSVRPTRDADGNITHSRSTIIDITELVQTQLELAEKQSHLTRYTRELEANAERLEQAAMDLKVERDKANSASTAKSQFLATMSHELRTPLNSIMGFSDILGQELFGPLGSTQYQEYAADIHKSGTHLLALIEDILDMTRIEAGKLKIRREVIVLGDVVSEAFMFLDGNAKENKITLVSNILPKLPLLFADIRAMKQVLINLLHNAVKFSQEGGSVTLAAVARNTNFIITVTDTGVGIAPDNIEKALEPFSQIERKHHASQTGTGLGLALSNALVKLHGGSLSIESEVGKGTEVTIILPVTTQIAWHPSMSVGIDHFDSDHQVLITMIDRLIVSFRAGKGSQAIEDTIGTLSAYGEIHFRAEENLMDTLGYPAVEEHKAYHQEFREWLGDLKENYGERQNGLVVSEISEYLGNWLYDHILNVDMAYKDFLEQMKDDVPPLLAGYDGVSSAPEV